ncbi:3-carboxy-cis,cis-muconate cycloisomerase, partial [Streptomyces fradiae]
MEARRPACADDHPRPLERTVRLDGARVLVAGATGVLGGAHTAELAGRGARPPRAGRDPPRPAPAAPAPPGA